MYQVKRSCLGHYDDKGIAVELDKRISEKVKPTIVISIDEELLPMEEGREKRDCSTGLAGDVAGQIRGSRRSKIKEGAAGRDQNIVGKRQVGQQG